MTDLATVLGPRIGATGDAALRSATSWVRMAGDMQQSEVSFGTLLKSGDKAKSFLGDLRAFAAKTPFEFKGLQAQARQLLAYGFSAEKIVPMLTSVGDAAGSLGGGGETISRIVRALGQMQAKGKVSAEEILQLAETGVPVYQILQDELGLTRDQLGDIGRQGITAERGIAALLAGFGKRYGGGMEKQAATMGGALSNLVDAADMAKTAYGDPLVGPITTATRALTMLTSAAEGMPAPVRGAVAWTTLLGGASLKAGGAALSAWKEYKEFVAIMEMSKTMKAGLTAATVADTAAERTKTGVANAEAAAIGQAGAAAEKAAAQKSLLARATSAMTGGLGMKGLLGSGAGAALGGGLGAGAAVTSAGLVGLAAGGGWMLGTKIAEAGNVGGARDLRDARARQRELEGTLGGTIGGAVTADQLARYREAMGIARPTAGGDLVVRIPGDQVLTRQAINDYRNLR